MRGDEDDWNATILSIQFCLQLEARHSRHANIGDKTSSLKLLTGLQEIFCRLKCPRGQSGRSQQAFQCYAHSLIIIDNRDNLIVSINGHSRERSAARDRKSVV